jgi:glutamine cyclotransferase
MKKCLYFIQILALISLLNCKSTSHHRQLDSEIQSYKKILNKIKRNELYYTQGLFFDSSNTVIESGGLYGESVLVKMEYPSMTILKKVKLDNKYFAEGTTKCGNHIFQLTWQNRAILKYSYPALELLDTVPLDDQIKEGWGLTTDGNIMYVTDGTNNIYYLDCNTLKVTNFVSVNQNNTPINYLNAMVYVNGFIYANKYFDNRIFKINPNSGEVVQVYDMNFLINEEFRSNTLNRLRLSSGDVLNGIAYNSSKKVFVVTGKKWGFYYEVNFN